MIKKATKNTATKTPKTPVFAFLKTRQSQTIIASFLILFACFLAIAFVSFFFNWQEDQSTLTQLTNKKVLSKNLLGKIGANLSHFFIYKGFGIGAFILAFQLEELTVFARYTRRGGLDFHCFWFYGRFLCPSLRNHWI